MDPYTSPPVKFGVHMASDIKRILRKNLYLNTFQKLKTTFRGAVVAQWIRSQTLNPEVPGLNLLAGGVVPLGKALYPHCLVHRKGLKAVGPLVACLFKQLAFLVK